MITAADVAHWREHAPWAAPEQVATKIRALFQRKKGRDLFDLWLAVTQAGADPAGIAACFDTYRPQDWIAARARANLGAKLADREFGCDIDQLVAEPPEGYTLEEGALVAHAVVDSIDRRLNFGF